LSSHESTLRQASRLSIKMTGKMPVLPVIPKAARLLGAARNKRGSPQIVGPSRAERGIAGHSYWHIETGGERGIRTLGRDSHPDILLPPVTNGLQNGASRREALADLPDKLIR